MDDRQAKELGQTTAFLAGDLRDWPLRCGFCSSEDLEVDHVRQTHFCNVCGRRTSYEMAAREREQRARKDVVSGVGAPILRYVESKKGNRA